MAWRKRGVGCTPSSWPAAGPERRTASSCSHVRNHRGNIVEICRRNDGGMDPLAGWTVAVTAERRAAEQVGLLQGRGATVLLAPTVRAERLRDDRLRDVTSTLVGDPPDLWVASTAA